MGIEMSMMNLLNTMYSKDLSRKVKSGLKTRRKNGKATCTMPPLGYVKDPEDTGKWNIEPNAAKIVRRIFDLALDGHTILGITNTLNEEQTMTLGQYREKYGFFKRVNRKVSDSEWIWNGNMVRQILKDYSYTGALVGGRATTIIVGNTATRKVPESERVIFEGHHEAIVTKNEYEKARGIVKSQRPSGIINHNDYPLGKIDYCGNCGLKMADSDTIDRHFTCSHKKNAGRYSKCKNTRYSADKIEYIVRRALKRQLLLMESLDKDIDTVQKELPDHTDEIHKLNEKLQFLKAGKTQSYKSYAERLIDKGTYLKQRTQLTEQIDEIERRLHLMTDPQEILKGLKEETDRYMGLAKRLYSLSELTQEMVDAFIERVNIYDEDHIEIVFKFRDLIREITEELETRRKGERTA